MVSTPSMFHARHTTGEHDMFLSSLPLTLCPVARGQATGVFSHHAHDMPRRNGDKTVSVRKRRRPQPRAHDGIATVNVDMLWCFDHFLGKKASCVVKSSR
jgi:hypothetical protein